MTAQPLRCGSLLTPTSLSFGGYTAKTSGAASRPIGRTRPVELPPLPEGAETSSAQTDAAVPDSGSRPVGKPSQDLKTSPSI